MARAIIKNIFITIFIIFCFSCGLTKRENISENKVKFEQMLVLNYSLLRRVVKEKNIVNEKVIANGTIYCSPDYSENDNDRVKYIREFNKCAIYLKTLPSEVILLDTSNAVSYLCSDPALDWFILSDFLKKGNKDRSMNKNVVLFKYYIGYMSRNIDSLYTYSKNGNKYPDSVIYVGKQINKGLISERSFVSDVFIINSIDSTNDKAITKIEDFLKADSVKKRGITTLYPLQNVNAEKQK